MKNSDVENIPASAAVYRFSNGQDNGSTFEYRSDDPALAYSGEGLLKKRLSSCACRDSL